MSSARESTTVGFRVKRVVRFGDCDPAGVAYYPEFFNWFHQAMETCFEEYLGIPYAKMIETVGFPTVQTSAEFQRPLPVGSDIEIIVCIEKMGKSSINWRFDIHRNSKIAAIGRVKTVCIAVDTDGFQFSSVSIPEDLLPKLQTLLVDSAI